MSINIVGGTEKKRTLLSYLRGVFGPALFLLLMSPSFTNNSGMRHKETAEDKEIITTSDPKGDQINFNGNIYELFEEDGSYYIKLNDKTYKCICKNTDSIDNKHVADLLHLEDSIGKYKYIAIPRPGGTGTEIVKCDGCVVFLGNGGISVNYGDGRGDYQLFNTTNQFTKPIKQNPERVEEVANSNKNPNIS